ncbi:hypothetical protein OIU84_021855 [Salix udensis]|uniref:UspA domain-containing protein n=1 Tax=Salix udensis TaxID=889485 RepID=A0AAD6KXN0_9ROSI|nr:hypothetical protein OIU84_021855 [Salix udensis]
MFKASNAGPIFVSARQGKKRPSIQALNYPCSTPSRIGCRIHRSRLVDVILIMEADSKKRAQNVVEKAREVCNNTGVNNVVIEVIEGDARNVICDVVDRHHASILVVGNHNYGSVKR